MSEPQAAKSEIRPGGAVPGVPYPIPPAAVEEFWPAIEKMLLYMESWTKLLSAQDVRRGIAKGEMQLWSVRTKTDHVALAVTQLISTSRGLVCRLWLVASHFLDDDRSIDALIDMCDLDARMRSCIALEIIGYPAWVERIGGRHTGVIIERDFKAQGTH